MSLKESINDIYLKIKYVRTTVLLLIIFILSNVLSFLTGALYIKDTMTQKRPIKIHSVNLGEIVPKYSLKIVEASVYGKKYYFPWCQGAENLKEKNKIYFSSATEAEKAGYELSATCKVSNTR